MGTEIDLPIDLVENVSSILVQQQVYAFGRGS